MSLWESFNHRMFTLFAARIICIIICNGLHVEHAGALYTSTLNPRNSSVEELSKLSPIFVESFGSSEEDFVTTIHGKQVLFIHDICLNKNASGISLHSRAVLSPIKISSGTWGPWPAKAPIYIAPLTSEPLFYNDSLVWIATEMHYSLTNIYHSFGDLNSAAAAVYSAMSIGGYHDIIGLGHYMPGFEKAVYFELLLSMTGKDTMYKLKENCQLCFKRMVLDIQTPFSDVSMIMPKLQYRTVSNPDVRLTWCSILQLDCELPKMRTISIIQRLNSRRILNIDFVCQALKRFGWRVNVLNFEYMTISEQFAAVQNSTTLIGYHGAGLAWAQYLHPGAAEIQLVGFRCSFESHSRMDFSNKYAILHADLNAVSPLANQSEADLWCEILEKKEHKHMNLTLVEEQLLNEQDTDVRNYDTVVDIPQLIETINNLDPIQC